MDADKNPTLEDRLATAIYSALKRSDPLAFIDGEPGSQRTAIDGTFNLEAVARMVLYDLGSGGEGGSVGTLAKAE